MVWAKLGKWFITRALTVILALVTVVSILFILLKGAF
jgi:hypothetical protein